MTMLSAHYESWYGRTLILKPPSSLMVESSRDYYSVHAGGRSWTVQSYCLRRDINDWLASNLSERYTLRSAEPRETILYFMDDKAATLFKMFWL